MKKKLSNVDPSVKEMLRDFNKMQNFWRGKSTEERGDYIKLHYFSGTTHKPWKNMTEARLIKFLNRTKWADGF